MYEPIYDQKHRMFCIAAEPDQKPEIFQKGLREPLLCEECEGVLSKWETYVKGLIFGGQLVIVDVDCGEGFRVSGVDYEKFKLFLLSVLWRASVSTLAFFSAVSLGKHESTIRAMLLSHSPGASHEYGCFIQAIACAGECFDVVKSPERVPVDNGFRGYRFLFGGFAWMFVVASHSFYFPLKQFFPTTNGTVFVMREDARNLAYLAADVRRLAVHQPEVERRFKTYAQPTKPAGAE